MRALILTDLHYFIGNSLSERKLDEIIHIEGDPDAVILCGDNADLSDGLHGHKVLFRRLRERFDCPQGFIIGNHELWGKPSRISSRRLLHDIFPAIGRDCGLTYLEHVNLQVNGFTFAGTYGHFDYSFLRECNGIDMEDLLRGTKQFDKKKITWGDRIYMDWEGKTDPEVCQDLVRGLEERVKRVKSNLITISHTIPILTLNGWPDSPEQFFCEAYSGSRSIGQLIERYQPAYHFCGHSHAPAQGLLGSTKAFNIGSEETVLRYALLDTNSASCKIITKPVN